MRIQGCAAATVTHAIAAFDGTIRRLENFEHIRAA